jgi:hypothetical protein
LLEHRRKQASKTSEHYYKEYTGVDAYRPGESKPRFLARHGAAAGMPADPDKVPYYLLIVGDPETIPYRFQYQLDVEYAVGRIYFDTLRVRPLRPQRGRSGDRQATLPRQAVFGVQNPDDPATNLSAVELARPLADTMARENPDWDVKVLIRSEASKARLGHLLRQKEPPALLFTASHGMGFPRGDRRQLPHQGALLCQDWPGPLAWHNKPIPEDFYFAADDVGEDAR